MAVTVLGNLETVRRGKKGIYWSVFTILFFLLIFALLGQISI